MTTTAAVNTDVVTSFERSRDNLRFRHFYGNRLVGRPTSDGYATQKHPVATVASVLDRDQNIMFAAMSRCLETDTFEKEFGRHIASKRLEKFDDYVMIESTLDEEQWDRGLFAMLKGDPVAISKEDWFAFLDDLRPLALNNILREEFLEDVRKRGLDKV